MSNETEPELAQSLEAMAEARQRLAEVPAEVVVTNHAMFAMPETAIALFPDVGTSFALPRLLVHRRPAGRSRERKRRLRRAGRP
ncbi:MAG: Enoyl-CoA hydratase/isomerase, partial [Actinomycetota bacterium]